MLFLADFLDFENRIKVAFASGMSMLTYNFIRERLSGK
jgi:hypothetical protein